MDDLTRSLKLSKSTLNNLSQEDNVYGQKVGLHWRFHKSVITRSPDDSMEIKGS